MGDVLLRVEKCGGFILKLLSILEDRNGGCPVSMEYLVEFLRRMAEEGLDPFSVDEDGPCSEFWRELSELNCTGHIKTTDVTGSGANIEAKIGLTGLGGCLCAFLELPPRVAEIVDGLTGTYIEGFRMET